MMSSQLSNAIYLNPNLTPIILPVTRALHYYAKFFYLYTHRVINVMCITQLTQVRVLKKNIYLISTIAFNTNQSLFVFYDNYLLFSFK